MQLLGCTKTVHTIHGVPFFAISQPHKLREPFLSESVASYLILGLKFGIIFLINKLIIHYIVTKGLCFLALNIQVNSDEDRRSNGFDIRKSSFGNDFHCQISILPASAGKGMWCLTKLTVIVVGLICCLHRA